MRIDPALGEAGSSGSGPVAGRRFWAGGRAPGGSTAADGFGPLRRGFRRPGGDGFGFLRLGFGRPGAGTAADGRGASGGGWWVFGGSLVLWAVPLVYLGYSLAIVVFVRGSSYDGLREYYSAHWPGAFDGETFFKTCFTEAWYDWITGHSMVLTVGLVAAMAGYLVFTRRVLRFFRDFLGEAGIGLRFLIRSFTGCPRGEKWVVSAFFAVLAGYWVILFFRAPMFLDETNSYLHFARQGFFFSVINYPVPNNHILLSVVCSWLYKLSFLSPALVMRLPSMLGAFGLYYLVFAVFRHYGGFRRAMIVVAGVAFVHLLSYYTVQGRGYLLQLFFIAVNAICAWRWFSGRSERGVKTSGYRYPMFVVSAVLGFYVNPLFVYHFLTISMVLGLCFWRELDYRNGLRLAGAVCLVGGACFVLYLPAILASGADSVLNNSSVSRQPLSFLRTTIGIFAGGLKFDFYYSTASLVIVPLAMIVGVVLYFRGVIRGPGYDYALYYLVASLAALGLMTVSKGRWPLERSLCYWIFGLNVMFVNVAYDLLRGRFWGLLVALVVGKDLFSVRWLFLPRFSIHSSMDWKIQHEPQALYPGLVAMHPASYQIMDSEDSYPTFLRLYLIEHGIGTPVLYSTHEALGEVILVSNVEESHIPLDGYVLWTDKERNAVFGLSGFYSIYVLKKLVH